MIFHFLDNSVILLTRSEWSNQMQKSGFALMVNFFYQKSLKMSTLEYIITSKIYIIYPPFKINFLSDQDENTPSLVIMLSIL